MKPLIFMIATMLLGTAGVLLFDPFLGVLVYYLYAILRPQYLWQWTLPDFNWSFYVAIVTIIAFLFSGARRPGFSFANRMVLVFGAWVCVTYFTAVDKDVAHPYFVSYLKVFLFYFVASRIIRTQAHAWALFVMAALVIGYIAYEANAIYFFQGGFLYIYRRGYAGLDSNGAGLMLAMGVPLCFFAWEGTNEWYRWIFAALIPAILHAVLMSFSRGAMLSLVMATPLFLARSRYRVRLGMAAVAVACLIPLMAGKEIRERFLSLSEGEADASIRERKASLVAGWRMGLENPIFGLGIRNANLFTHLYGGHLKQTIHCQYLQLAADSGLVSVALYAGALVSCWASVRRARRMVVNDESPAGRRAYVMASGLEASLFIFSFGSAFLAMESFELAYLVMLLCAQLPLLPVNVEVTEAEKQESGGPETVQDLASHECHAESPVGIRE